MYTIINLKCQGAVQNILNNDQELEEEFKGIVIDYNSNCFYHVEDGIKYCIQRW